MRRLLGACRLMVVAPAGEPQRPHVFRKLPGAPSRAGELAALHWSHLRVWFPACACRHACVKYQCSTSQRPLKCAALPDLVPPPVKPPQRCSCSTWRPWCSYRRTIGQRAAAGPGVQRRQCSSRMPHHPLRRPRHLAAGRGKGLLWGGPSR